MTNMTNMKNPANPTKFTVKLYKFDGTRTTVACEYDHLTAADAEEQEKILWEDEVESRVAFTVPMYIPVVEIEGIEGDVTHNRLINRWEYRADANDETPAEAFDSLPELAAWLEGQGK